MTLLHASTCRRCFGRTALEATAALPFVTLAAGRASARPDTAAVPGASVTTRSHVLDSAAGALQTKRPIDAMSAFLNGFHFYANDMGGRWRRITSART